MCSILNEKTKKGKPRERQLKRWGLYFSHERNGNKMIVTEIFDPPATISRGGNFTPYLEAINKLLIQILLRSCDKRIILSKNRLLKMLNMINDNYKAGFNNISSLSQYLNIDKIDIYDFYNSTDDTLKRNLEASLKDLKNKKALFHHTELMVVKNNLAYAAKSEDLDIIYPIQKRILDEMNYSSMVDVFKSGQLKEYTDRTNELLLKEAGISYVYEAYNIYLNKSVLQEELSKIEIRELKSSLNESVSTRIVELAEKRAARQIAKTDKGFGDLVFDKKSYRIKNSYVPNQKKLVEVLISEKEANIGDALKKKVTLKKP